MQQYSSRDRFTFQPLLYEFLSQEMSDDQVYPRYDEPLDGSNVIFVQDTVQAIDLPNRRVELASGLHYTYNHLVLALGSVINYFGVEGAKEKLTPFNQEVSRAPRYCPWQYASQL